MMLTGLEALLLISSTAAGGAAAATDGVTGAASDAADEVTAVSLSQCQNNANLQTKAARLYGVQKLLFRSCRGA
eukprot:1006840-Amphidinium_carterae.3